MRKAIAGSAGDVDSNCSNEEWQAYLDLLVTRIERDSDHRLARVYPVDEREFYRDVAAEFLR